MAEFYQYKDIVVRFDVFKDGQYEHPTSARLAIYDPNKNFIKNDVPKIIGSEVKYILKGDLVEEVGTYIFVFNVTIRGMGEHTHIVKVKVKKLPIPKGKLRGS